MGLFNKLIDISMASLIESAEHLQFALIYPVNCFRFCLEIIIFLGLLLRDGIPNDRRDTPLCRFSGGI
ncbi:hypothetical protein TWF751_008191 [Orbilia oligospora]|nr:hypothetical protein TWF751_008191 [Orbilia oligospora]